MSGSDRRDRGGGRQRPAPRPGKRHDGRTVRTLELRVDAIAAGGEGVGRLDDGRVAFVHRAAPGELVQITPVREQKRWVRARLTRVLEPSPVRREATCVYYAVCGGCTLEHLEYPAQLEAKARIVSDAFARIGKLEIPTPRVVASPLEQRYRNRVSFALRRLGNGSVVAGFHALGEPNRVVDMDGRCMLPEEAISRVWDRLRHNWGPDANRLPSGELLRLTLRATQHGQVSLLVEGGFSEGSPQELIDSVDGLDAVWHRPGRAPAGLIAGAPGLPETWGDETFEVSGTAFLQVNRQAAALLEEYVMEQIGEPGGLRIVDAYCGIGLHARRLARAGAHVIGIELDPDAVAEARRIAPPNMQVEQGEVETELPAHLPADLVILNPPRAGVAPQVTDALLRAPVQRIVYVSCDPATLARDLERLQSGYRVEAVRCFDLFPQTAHVETVVTLRHPGISANDVAG